MSIVPKTYPRSSALILLVTPVVVFVSFLAHPHVGTRVGEPGVAEAIAHAVAASPAVWALSHLALAVGSAFVALAFLALRAHLRTAGGERWSAFGVPFAVLGSVLFALLPAMEMGALAAHRAGASVAAFQQGLDPYFAPVLLAGSAVFAVGAVAFAQALRRTEAFAPALGRLMAVGLVVVAASRFVPVFPVLFWVQSAGLALAFWPAAYALWSRAGAGRAAAREQRAPA